MYINCQELHQAIKKKIVKPLFTSISISWINCSQTINFSSIKYKMQLKLTPLYSFFFLQEKTRILHVLNSYQTAHGETIFSSDLKFYSHL